MKRLIVFCIALLSLFFIQSAEAQITSTRPGFKAGILTVGDSLGALYTLPSRRSGVAGYIMVAGTDGTVTWDENITLGTVTVTDTMEVRMIADIDTLVSSTGKVYFKDNIQTAGNIAAATYETNVTATELGYVSEVTSDIQAQIDAGVVGTEDSLNPLINRMVLDNVLIVEAGAGATIRVLGPAGGNFTVIIHDTLTAVAHDSALAVTDDDITSVWIDEDGALQTATTGFPEELSGSEDSTIIQVASVGTASTSIVWINTHYDHKKDRLIDLHEFIEEIHHYSIHSGFEVSEGTSSNLGFDFGAAGTTNDMHSIHGWRAAHADDADLTFIDDIYSGGSGTTFGNTVYGNNQAMTNNYYSKFRLWIVTNNAGINEFHITRSTSEWADVAHAEVASWPALPAGYSSNQLDLIGVVYKKSKTWDNLDGVKDWIITDFTATGVSSSGGAVGLGPADVGAIVGDSLQQDTLNLTGNMVNVPNNIDVGDTLGIGRFLKPGVTFSGDSITIDSLVRLRDVVLGSSGNTGGGVTVASSATFLIRPLATFEKNLIVEDTIKIGTFEGSAFRDLTIKQTTASRGAIRIEEASGSEAYEIGIDVGGHLRFYDDDGSYSLSLTDATNLVYVPDSILIGKASRLIGDVKMEGDLFVEGQFTSTLSLDTEHYYGRSVLQFMATVGDAADDYVDWANNKWDDAAAGVHSDNTTNYLTDHQSITLTDNSDNDGIHLDFTDIDLTHFADGDTSVMADYINFSIYILTADINDLNDTDGLGFILAGDAQGTLTNYFPYLIDDSDLSNGWNHFKVAKSVFEAAKEGSPNWNSIKGVSLYLDGEPNASAEVIVTIDNIQMVRDDPDAAEPNPFQSEGAGDVWTADWTQEGTGNTWLVEESGRLIIMATAADRIFTSNSHGDFDASGVVHIDGASTAYLFSYDSANPTGRAVVIASGNLLVDDSTGANHTASFSVSSGDRVYWRVMRKGTSITGMASHDGSNWTTVSTFCYAGVKKLAWPGTGGTPMSKQSSIAFSTVEYAAEAGVAQRLKGGLFIDLESGLTTHGIYDGKTARIDVDENSIGFGGALHMDADGNLIDCDADAAATMPCMALAIEAGVGSGKLLLKSGKIVNTAWNWTTGDIIYVSTTVGALQNTAPVGSGDVVQVIGIALGPDAIDVNISLHTNTIP